MIDFKNSAYLKLRRVKNEDCEKLVAPVLIHGENILSSYKSVRDCVIFTNKRVISVNIQGVTGKKRDFTTLPYSKIIAFSVETSGIMDIDSELVLWFSGLGKVNFEFSGGSNIVELSQIIAGYVL